MATKSNVYVETFLMYSTAEALERWLDGVSALMGLLFIFSIISYTRLKRRNARGLTHAYQIGATEK